VHVDGGAVHVREGFIDMVVRRITPAAGAAIVLFAAKIAAGASQQLDDSAEAAAAIGKRIHVWVIFEIFTVDHGGAIDFTDSSFHLVVGLDQAARHIGFFLYTKQHLSPAQVASGAQISGMVARSVGIHGGGNNGRGKADETQGEHS
jgi:hypothetical protein